MMKPERWNLLTTFVRSANHAAGRNDLAQTTLWVLDVDVTGIDATTDRATGVAVLPVVDARFCMADIGYYRFANPASPSCREDYDRMVIALGNMPIVTQNIRFVRHMLKQAGDDFPIPTGPWIDIASSIHGALGTETDARATLKDWQSRMSIQPLVEHSAVADVVAIALCLQTLISYGEEIGIHTLQDLERAQKARDWLRG